MVEGARLELVCAATYRGFESPSLRHFSPAAIDEGRVPRTVAREPRQVREEATVATFPGLWVARLSPFPMISVKLSL